MKRFCLSVGIFLLLFSGSLATLTALSTLIPQKAEAQVVTGDGNGFLHYTTIQATFIDAAHVQVKTSGTWPNNGNGIDLSVFSGMYYSDDINVGDTGAVYYQGGPKKVGVPNGCQSTFSITPARSLPSLPVGPVAAFWTLRLPPTGTTNTSCSTVSFRANGSNYTTNRINNPSIATGGGASNIRYYLADLSTMNEVDNDPAYDSKEDSKYTLKKVANGSDTVANGDQFLYNTQNGKGHGGSCPDYMKITNVSAGPGLMTGDLMNQNGSGSCTPGGKKGSYAILGNTPDEIAKGNLLPPTTTGGGSSSDPNGGLDNKCPLKQWWQLNWIACPIIESINDFISSLSNSIQEAVLLDVNDLFGNGDNAKSFKAAFNTFRAIGLSILIAAALAVIATQASGFEIINALSVKRFMPQFVGLVILISLMYPLEKYAVEAVNGIAVWVPNAMYAPFASAYNGLHAVSGWSLATTLVGGAGLVAILGPFATLSLLITAFLIFVTAAITVTVVKMAFIGALIAAPAAIAFKAIPNLEFIWDFVKGVLKGAVAFFLLVPIVFALSKIMALLVPGTGPIHALEVETIVLLPFGALPAIAQRAGGALATITGMVNDRSRGAFDRLKNYRRSTVQQRATSWKAGSLYQDEGAVRTRLNNLGRRVALGHKGFYPTQSRALMALQQSVDAENAAKNDPRLAQLANDDMANAILGGSGGSSAAGRRIADHMVAEGILSRTDADAAYKRAEAVGFKRDKAAYAFKSTLQNKARGVGAGDLWWMQNAAANLAGGVVDDDGNFSGGNTDQFMSTMYEGAYHARSGGRSDLGGASYTVPSNSARNDVNELVNATGVDRRTARSHLATMDGMARTGVPQMMNGHTSQAKADVQSVRFMLEHGNEKQKREALYRANEIAKNLSQASGDTQEIFNGLVQDLGIDHNLTQRNPSTGQVSAVPISVQLATRYGAGVGAGGATLTGTEIEAGSRAYGNEAQYQQNMMGGAPGAPGAP